MALLCSWNRLKSTHVFTKSLWVAHTHFKNWMIYTHSLSCSRWKWGGMFPRACLQSQITAMSWMSTLHHLCPSQILPSSRTIRVTWPSPVPQQWLLNSIRSLSLSLSAVITSSESDPTIPIVFGVVGAVILVIIVAIAIIIFCLIHNRYKYKVY